VEATLKLNIGMMSYGLSPRFAVKQYRLLCLFCHDL
jgi:hypothetical protein